MYTIDEVIEGIESVVEWSIEAASPVGYFAALYKGSTLAIRDAIGHGLFDDETRMVRLDVEFARRYFDAVNRRFDGRNQKPTQVWQVAFDANGNDELIILQHLLIAMSAHMHFDLGIAAVTTAADSLEPLQSDFNAVNAILATQLDGVLSAIEQVSPASAQHRSQLMANGIGFIPEALAQARDLAWTFARQLANEPESNCPNVIHDHDTIFSWWASRYLKPPQQISEMFAAIAKEESRDIAHNIRVLDPTSA
ncbi:DUF5995 family protein [Mycobacterium sp. MMS18-G62]